ncbi:MAG: class I SAM-dependent methyltransferase [Pseudobdellovibrionaceae bacterium]
MHSAAAVGFDKGYESYEKGRPEYPAEAIEFIMKYFHLNEDTSCVDLGAGTGKLTRALCQKGLSPVAIEPVAGMQKKFKELLPKVTCITGTAEKIPIESNSQDVIFVAQAFHWFQGKQALAEIARVLRPNGYLILLWNTRDESVDWVSKLTELIDPQEGTAPRYKTGLWQKAFSGNTDFTPLQKKEFAHNQQGPIDMVVERVASISFISALEATPKTKLLEQVKSLLKTHPQTKGKETITFPYRTDLWWCRKVGGAFSK